MPKRLSLFATAARGTEELLSEELKALGAVKIRRDRGGVRFDANLNECLRIALWTRLAKRILYPLGEMEAEGADGLYEAGMSIPWEEHLTLSSTFAVEATLKDSEHAHSGFVALKIKDAIADRLRQKLGGRPDVDTRRPTFKVVAHLAKTKLSLSFDLCGDPLNRRGYRIEPTVAPLKETLAAAMLAAVGYTGDEPLFDPMCGSGTLLFEAALIAKRRAPSLKRDFAIERWPSMDDSARDILRGLRAEAKAGERPTPFPIIGVDKNDEAVIAARRNAGAAGVTGEVRILEADALGPLPVEGIAPGLLISNPPYGDRLTGGQGQKGMKSFYFKLSDNFAQLEGWRMAILCGNPSFESAFHRKPEKRQTLWNGPIECQLISYPPIRAKLDAKAP